MHHSSSFLSSTEWTGRHAAAYLCDDERIGWDHGFDKQELKLDANQDYAGHHEAKQTDRDDGAPDHTGLPVEFFVL